MNRMSMWIYGRTLPNIRRSYATGLTNQDGSTARVFSSWDASTTDLHFSWMERYGIDGVFIQRFFGATRTAGKSRRASRGHSRQRAGSVIPKTRTRHGRDVRLVPASTPPAKIAARSFRIGRNWWTN